MRAVGSLVQARLRRGGERTRAVQQMRLTNECYVIEMGTRNFSERYRRDAKGWVKVSARGRVFRMTAEQVFNHLLPALAVSRKTGKRIRPGVRATVEYDERPSGKSREGKGE